MDYQRKMRKKFGLGAAIPGESEHHLGTTVDIREAWDKKVYGWLIGSNPNLIPHAIEYGFVPTTTREVWHFRYVGTAAAEEYWKKTGAQIIASHSRRLR